MFILKAKFQFFYFTQGCFKMDPLERLTCEQLLDHPYFDKKFTEMFEQNERRSNDDQQRRERRAKRQQMNQSRANVSVQYRFNLVSTLTLQLNAYLSYGSGKLPPVDFRSLYGIDGNKMHIKIS